MSGETGDIVSYPFLKNVVGMSVDDESLKSVPHAKGELFYHVPLKTGQAGAIIGAVIGAGVGAIRRAGPVSRSLMNGSRNGVLIGVPLGAVVLYGTMSKIAKKPDADMEYAYFDRSYRLRNNRGQLRVDRASLVGCGVGAVTAVTCGGSVLGATAVGLASGTLIGALYNVATKSE